MFICKIGFDAAENEPSKCSMKFGIDAPPPPLGVDRPNKYGTTGQVTVVIEENNWPSQRLMAYAFAIFARELLGYHVVFNPVLQSTAGAYRRVLSLD